MAAGPFDQFQWKPQPEAQALVNELLGAFLAKCPGAAMLAKRMEHDTATRFGDWVDSIQWPRDAGLRARLLDVGFDRRATPGAPDCFVHPGAMFPTIILDTSPVARVFVKAESVVKDKDGREWHVLQTSPKQVVSRTIAPASSGLECWRSRTGTSSSMTGRSRITCAPCRSGPPRSLRRRRAH